AHDSQGAHRSLGPAPRGTGPGGTGPGGTGPGGTGPGMAGPGMAGGRGPSTSFAAVLVASPDVPFEAPSQRLDERVAEEPADGRPDVGVGIFDVAAQRDTRRDGVSRLVLEDLRGHLDHPLPDFRQEALVVVPEVQDLQVANERLH